MKEFTMPGFPKPVPSVEKPVTCMGVPGMVTQTRKQDAITNIEASAPILEECFIKKYLQKKAKLTLRERNLFYFLLQIYQFLPIPAKRNYFVLSAFRLADGNLILSFSAFVFRMASSAEILASNSPFSSLNTL